MNTLPTKQPLFPRFVSSLLGIIFTSLILIIGFCIVAPTLAEQAVQLVLTILSHIYQFFWPLNMAIFSVAIFFVHTPIHSLLCLIAVFLHAIILLLSLKVEFLALLLLIIYVGAIAVLFLFVVMMFNLKDSATRLFYFKITRRQYGGIFLISFIVAEVLEEYYNRLTQNLLINMSINQMLDAGEVFPRTVYHLSFDFFGRIILVPERKEPPLLLENNLLQKYMDLLSSCPSLTNNIFFINDIKIFSIFLYTRHAGLLLLLALILLISMLGALTLTNLAKISKQ